MSTRLREQIERVVSQLRHAYEQLVKGNVHPRNHTQFADGLIAPQIRTLEMLLTALTDAGAEGDHEWCEKRFTWYQGELQRLLNVIAELKAEGDHAASTEPQVVIAERIARDAHSEQKDTVTSAPYITHVERVVAMVDGEAAKAVAWLHDVLEDTNMTARDLARAGISDYVIDAVELLTRDHGMSYADYISGIRGDADPLAIAVKLADLRDHLQPNCPERLRPRYEAALKVLQPTTSEARGPLPPDRAMVDAAEMLWVVLANVSGGDWTKQSPEWQEAAARWRDNYFAAVRLLTPPPADPREGWQPIESAKQEPLLEVLGNFDGVRRVMWWSTLEGWMTACGATRPAQPTHWMPLPDPPSPHTETP